MKDQNNCLLYIIWIIFPLSSLGQFSNDYYKNIHKAKVWEYSGNIDSALLIYDKAFETATYVHQKHLNKALFLAQKTDNNVLIKKFQFLKEKFTKNLNDTLISIIDSLSKEDQRVRQKRFEKANRLYLKSEQKEKKSKRFYQAELLRKEWLQVDSTNILYLLKLFDKYGFISEELVGFETFRKVHVMLLHFDRDTNNLILQPILKEALEKGKILPLDYALIIDRHHLNFHPQSQKYWTWPFSDKVRPKLSDSDIQEIQKMREEIGIYGSILSLTYRYGYWVLTNKF